MDETIAIIPARGESKRVPAKNLASFKGKPLVAHTIEQALGSNIFRRILVSTDEKRIMDVASKYPVEILQRNPDLSHDDATLLDVIRDVITRKGIRHDTCIGLLLVTAPLRTIADLKGAYNLFVQSDKRQAVVTVCLDINRIDLSWYVSDGHLVPVFPERYALNIGKQARGKTYHFNDACIFDLAGNFLKDGRNLFGEDPLPYIMPHERSIFVDYRFQLKIIQMIGENGGWE